MTPADLLPPAEREGLDLEALDLDAFEIAARDAPHGPWFADGCTVWHEIQVRGPHGEPEQAQEAVAESSVEGAIHIATFDPPKVLRLIAAARAPIAATEAPGRACIPQPGEGVTAAPATARAPVEEAVAWTIRRVDRGYMEPKLYKRREAAQAAVNVRRGYELVALYARPPVSREAVSLRVEDIEVLVRQHFGPGTITSGGAVSTPAGYRFAVALLNLLNAPASEGMARDLDGGAG